MTVGQFFNGLIVAGILIALFGILNYIQSLKTRTILNRLSEQGITVSGNDYGFLRTKYIIFAAVLKDGTVIDAQLLKVVRFVTLPKILDLKILVGENLNTLRVDELDVEDRLKAALSKLIKNWHKIKGNVNTNIPSVYPKNPSKNAFRGTAWEKHNKNMSRKKKKRLSKK
ncbi:MAG: hypothetical protein LBD41_04205 [Clostridiales Family XIII bacterium]|jgi:hypothetical protein|nr:hypothetical protein [Clostridiales Family XIII bacterium]